jgi:hypothetical protein
VLFRSSLDTKQSHTMGTKPFKTHAAIPYPRDPGP